MGSVNAESGRGEKEEEEEGAGGEGGVLDMVAEILQRCENDLLTALGNTWDRNLTFGNMNTSENIYSGYSSGVARETPETSPIEGEDGLDGVGHAAWPSVHPTHTLGVQEILTNGVYSVCDHCNFTDGDLETLFTSGTCTPSDFSSYMPVIYQMYTCIFVIALLGNILVLYTVASNRKMHTVTNLFIANLAVGDLLIIVFCVPFSVASIIVLQYWPFGEAMCVFVNYAQVSKHR